MKKKLKPTTKMAKRAKPVAWKAELAMVEHELQDAIDAYHGQATALAHFKKEHAALKAEHQRLVDFSNEQRVCVSNLRGKPVEDLMYRIESRITDALGVELDRIHAGGGDRPVAWTATEESARAKYDCAPGKITCTLTAEEVRTSLALAAVESVARHYLGLNPGQPIRAAKVSAPDQFYCTVNLALLLHALGGEFGEFADAVTAEAKERSANTKAHLASAGLMLGKE